MSIQTPLPLATAYGSVARSCWVTCGLLLRGRLHQPHGHLGHEVRFGNGTSAMVYRETVIDRPPAADPCVLVVRFRLRGIRGRGHALFRRESLLNTPLFAGFPGLVSKLWLRHDEQGFYRGVYQWDGADSAEAYARSLWRILALVSAKGTIGYEVLPAIDLDLKLG